jgi:hypothetical protein
MQFDRDQYLLLSRTGNVPSALRFGSRPRAEGEGPGPGPAPEASRGSPGARWVAPIQSLALRGHRAALDLSAGVRAAWTAFGPGREDEFRGR